MRFDAIHFDLLDALRLHTRVASISLDDYAKVATRLKITRATERLRELISAGFLNVEHGVLAVTEKGLTLVRTAERAKGRYFLAEAVRLMNAMTSDV